MNKLGLMYEMGRGVPKDPAQAMQWHQKAAALGDMYVVYNIGKMYLARAGIPQNLPEAFRWFRKAADLGNAESMNLIASAYEERHTGFPKRSEAGCDLVSQVCCSGQ